ncbi:hypothetical protein DPMN_140611 [Dreissena polymorpha]|uniref:Uncharacterized protein n=1 Tax=Dreissena polymorpha TaxID=45954 RepID=A0A9D4G8G1_DREPO|nr:hypothetical protein DPMN_140611 [Dreissena polymorpha]
MSGIVTTTGPAHQKVLEGSVCLVAWLIESVLDTRDHQIKCFKCGWILECPGPNFIAFRHLASPGNHWLSYVDVIELAVDVNPKLVEGIVLALAGQCFHRH